MPNISEEKAVGQNGLLYFWQGIKQKLAGKVDVEPGKGLSSNDYTAVEKAKLGGIEEGANKTIVHDGLDSTSTTDALSAKQGKALNDRIDAALGEMGNLGYGDMMKAVYDANGDGIVDDAAKLGGKDPSAYALADGSNVKTAFTPASTRANIASGEALSTVLGKVAKFFGDLKNVAFTGSYKDLIDKPSIPTVTNDLTNELKGHYDAAYTHSQAPHAPADAQANIIEKISVNGAAQDIVGKAVDITVPTAVSQLSDADNYAKKSDLTNVYKYKGSKPTYDDLPKSGNIAGDVWNVEADGMNWGWTGTSWDNLGTIFTINYVSNSDIDSIMAT